MVKICSENVSPESHDTHIDESYGFTLSNFQRHAIEAIHTGNHVLITAHTRLRKNSSRRICDSILLCKGKKGNLYLSN